jgi:hypothetical protein
VDYWVSKGLLIPSGSAQNPGAGYYRKFHLYDVLQLAVLHEIMDAFAGQQKGCPLTFVRDISMYIAPELPQVVSDYERGNSTSWKFEVPISHRVAIVVDVGVIVREILENAEERVGLHA